jgi:hypothetical protein
MLDPVKNKVEATTSVVSEKEQEKKRKFIGRIKPNKGHKVFEFNTKTFELRVAEVEESDTISLDDSLSTKNGTSKKSIITKDDCVYFSALNRKNALKKIEKSIKNARG